MSRCTVSPLLRFALRLDAVASAASGIAMSAAPAALHDLTAIPAALLFGAGVFCLGYAAMIFTMSTRARLPAAGVWAVVLGNLGWAAGCVVLAFDVTPAPTSLGVAFLVAQGGAVAFFAALQFLGLKRSPAATLSAAHA